MRTRTYPCLRSISWRVLKLLRDDRAIGGFWRQAGPTSSSNVRFQARAELAMVALARLLQHLGTVPARSCWATPCRRCAGASGCSRPRQYARDAHQLMPSKGSPGALDVRPRLESSACRACTSDHDLCLVVRFLAVLVGLTLQQPRSAPAWAGWQETFASSASTTVLKRVVGADDLLHPLLDLLRSSGVNVRGLPFSSVPRSKS